MMLEDHEFERDSCSSLMEMPKPDVNVVNWYDRLSKAILNDQSMAMKKLQIFLIRKMEEKTADHKDTDRYEPLKNKVVRKSLSHSKDQESDAVGIKSLQEVTVVQLRSPRSIQLGSTSGIKASGEHDLWLMRIEQYFLMTDYSLLESNKNGNKVLKKTVGTSKETYKPTSVEEKLDRRNKMKAKGTLLMALPNKRSTEVSLILRCKITHGSH
nr:hypothetical protein [Tanacetum cinerariifolium]